MRPLSEFESFARDYARANRLPIEQARRELAEGCKPTLESMAPWYERVAHPYERTETVR